MVLSGFVQALAALRQSLKIPSRRNGLRHGFVTFHSALHANENLTASLAGNTAAMVHAHHERPWHGCHVYGRTFRKRPSP